MKLLIAPAALKALARMPQRDRAAMLTKLKAVAAAPDEYFGWARRLERSAAFRIRHGDWRAIYRIDRRADEMVVDRVAKREDAYR